MDNIEQPLVSVIVPCYNCGPFLGETLDSVLGQAYTNWECIIVDNGSTDDSKRIAEDFARKDKRFISITQTLKGVASARNAGIKSSRGKYILPLDADDKIERSYIQKSVQTLEKDNTLKVVYCEVSFFGSVVKKWDLPAFSIKQMLMDNVLFCSAVYRRADYDKTKGYNELMVTGFEDWDFWLSLIKEDTEVFRIPEVLFFYRIRKDSRNNSLNDESIRKLRNQIYENHKELYVSKLNMGDLIFENYLTKNKLESFLESNDYKLGRLLMGPFRQFKKLFSK